VNVVIVSDEPVLAELALEAASVREPRQVVGERGLLARVEVVLEFE